MNIRILPAVLVTSVLMTMPRTLAAQHLERSTAVATTAETGRTHPKRASGWGQITADDIAKTPARTAYDAVSHLRASWLRPRAVTSMAWPSGIQVYVDGFRLGGIQELRHIDANAIDSVEYLNGVEATHRLHIRNIDGAILVTMRR